ncbi:hypothetical protein [Ensifer sp. LCM 4579]|uniref:hypothetical protein n=1 Tax=Ensifer sp. LCM 4579 TaxID=1848292 RepID=UPI0008DA41DA|nr:hypothetical protein [Ensifer sp. LCM 4579]OHV78064.1 hypothetical protein LCM4579_06920 [Ensifer sp. LCM 4579]
MSDCCSPPGVGDELQGLLDPSYDSYNPSEVRLYGRPALRNIVVDQEDTQRIVEELKRAGLKDEGTGNILKTAEKIIESILVNVHSKQIILRAVDSKGNVVTLPVNVNIPSENYRKNKKHYIKSIGVIYGYAYEGHCYKLPKPQIMYLPSEPRAILGSDCGCDCGYVPELGYAVWQVDKLERVIALDVRSDDVKTLILEENTPGNRSPMAYAQTMALAPQRHRD